MLSQDPTACQPERFASSLLCCVSQNFKQLNNHSAALQRPAVAITAHPERARPFVCDGRVLLLRKEVIQPHLPVRLPCYDFVPIASPTFDHSPPYGLGHGLRVLPTFVT